MRTYYETCYALGALQGKLWRAVEMNRGQLTAVIDYLVTFTLTGLSPRANFQFYKEAWRDGLEVTITRGMRGMIDGMKSETGRWATPE